MTYVKCRELLMIINYRNVLCLHGTIKISTFRPRAGSVDEKLVHSTTRPLRPPPRHRTISYKPSPPPPKHKTPLDRSTAPPRREQPHGGGSVAALLSVYRGGKGNGSRAAAAYIYTAGRQAPRSVNRTPAAGSNIRPVVSRTPIKT